MLYCGNKVKCNLTTDVRECCVHRPRLGYCIISKIIAITITYVCMVNGGHDVASLIGGILCLC